MHDWTLTSPEINLPPARVFGFTSRSVDRFDPSVEIITLASKCYHSMEMHLSLSPQTVSKYRVGQAKFKNLLIDKTLALGEGTFVDMRFDSPDNWAHNIFYQAPLAVKIKQAIGDEVTVILPENLSAKIYDLYDLLDIEFVTTNRDVVGRLVQFDKSKVEIVTRSRRDWIDQKIGQLYNSIDEKFHASSYPKKAYINRKDTRRIKGKLVPGLLKEHGFEEIFLEDYSAAEQIRILDAAEQIVGIHGAGLAPLLFNRPGGRPKTLIGLMPALQVTSGFRLLSHQCNMNWVGVRGKIEAVHAKHLVADSLPPFATSHFDFEVCPSSLNMAIEETVNV